MKKKDPRDQFKDDPRDVFGTVIAIAGPKDLTGMIKDQIKELYDQVYIFDVPDDYGEFPDTSGYTSENFEQFESEVEDGALYPFMTKCIDAVMDWNTNRSNTLDRLGYQYIESFLHAPKFGGKVFACGGFIRAFAPGFKIEAQNQHPIH